MRIRAGGVHLLYKCFLEVGVQIVFDRDPTEHCEGTECVQGHRIGDPFLLSCAAAALSLGAKSQKQQTKPQTLAVWPDCVP